MPGVVAQLRRWAEDAAGREAGDGLLLRRFLESRDDAAFAGLLCRHGPMVFGVCRRVLQDPDAAEDVFQATFLVLLRRAGSIRRCESLGSWLHGVAYRLAQRARADATRRRRHETRAGARRVASRPDDPGWQDISSVLDEELNRLPEIYRLPLVLCYLQGRTLAEAARQLSWKGGTLAGRLARARHLLGVRLARRGVSLGAGLGAALGEPWLLAAVPRRVFVSTARLAALLNGPEAGVGLSAQIDSLAEGMVRAMFLKRVTAVVAGVLVCACLAVGAAGLARHALPEAPTAQAPPRAEATPKTDAGPSGRQDATGEPLPAEAVSRFGTSRLRHANYIATLLFTPDGKRLISQSYGETRMWDTATGRLLHEFPKEAEAGNWHGSALSPDGKTLATPGEKTMRLWDVATAKPIRTIGKGRFIRVCFSPDGKLLASQGGSRFECLDLWDVATGKNLRSWTVADGAECACESVFTKDGKTLICGHRDKALRFWEVATGAERKKIVLGGLAGPQQLRMLALSPDGKTLAVTAVQTPHIYLIDVAQGKERARLVGPDRVDPAFGRRQGFGEIAFTPDGKTLVAGDIADSLILWDMSTLKERGRLARDFRSLSGLVISPDGKVIASAPGGKTVRLTDLASGRDLLETPGHTGGVYGAAFTADGKAVATIGGGKDILVWDAATGRELRRLKGHTAEVTSLRLSADRRLLVSKAIDRTIRFWDLASGKEIRKTHNPADVFGAGSLSPDGKRVVVLDIKPGQPSMLRLLDTATGKELGSQKSEHPWFGAAFTPDGKTIVAWSGDRTVRLLDPSSAKERKQYRIDEAGGPAAGGGKGYSAYTLVLSQDGKLLAYGSQRNSLHLMETETGKVLHQLDRQPDGVSAIAFSPDDTMLAWGGWRDPTVHLIDLATGEERHRFVGPTGRVETLSFAPDGTMLVAGYADTTAVVWDLTGRLRQAPTWGKPLTPTDFQQAWTALAGNDAPQAFRMMQKLVGSPRDAVAYLGERLKPVAAADAKHIARLIADLNSSVFLTRERAARELDQLGEGALAACRAALAGNPSEEVRRRLEAHVKKATGLSPQRLRTIRALAVLEMCGTVEARAVLAALAEGAPEADLTQQAMAARKRLVRP
jgi:RNA polymerase sigma factor (sigma-70 family)